MVENFLSDELMSEVKTELALSGFRKIEWSPLDFGHSCLIEGVGSNSARCNTMVLVAGRVGRLEPSDR